MTGQARLRLWHAAQAGLLALLVLVMLVYWLLPWLVHIPAVRAWWGAR